MSVAISIKNLGKSYTLTHQTTNIARYGKLSDTIIQSAKTILGINGKNSQPRDATETFWALDDISFDIKHGERVGIIGRNGAGKSTLLKIISRITSPTRGRIEIVGRVSSLLEVGTGFHPELTGRENIFLNGAVLGMSRTDIARRFDEIVAFAEVERFLDTPVKRYSSGMYMRLAFAVAAHLEPDILIVDEVLAVGDAAFQKKCLGKMKDVGSEGRTVLFVSHNMGAISEFCNKVVLLEHGNVKASGEADSIIPLYMSNGSLHNQSGVFDYAEIKTKTCQIKKISLKNDNGDVKNNFDISESIEFEINYIAYEAMSELQITVTINKDALDVLHAFDNDDHAEISPTSTGEYIITYKLPAYVLKEGTYNFRVTAGTPTELIVDHATNLTFEISNQSVSTLRKSYRADRTGVIISPGKWRRISI